MHASPTGPSRAFNLHAVGNAARQSIRSRSGGAPWLRALVLAAPLAVPVSLHAAPQGGTVTAGQAQVARSGNVTSITQQSNRAVIDWRSFSVAAGEAVDFRQPGAGSVTLNRVLGADPSSIFGRISANGTVYLVNPNGVLFGQGAQVNVGGLVASTANISNANFMAGVDRFDQPGNAGAAVDNQGVIRVAENGIAALVGRRVSNSGFIVARLGKVGLVGGDAFALDLVGDRLVSLILDPNAMEQLTDAQGRPLMARVDNTGNIQAGGGRVELTADTVSRLLDNAINVGGDLRAGAVEARNGTIRITGGTGTDVSIGGVLQAGGSSGGVSAAGRDVTVAATAAIDLGTGAGLILNAGRNIAIGVGLNGLVPGGVPGAGVTAVAGNDINIGATLALNNGPLSLTATNGSLIAAAGALLQAGDGAITLRGGNGVSVNDVLTSGAVSIASGAGAVQVRGTIGAPTSGATAVAAGAVSVDGRRGVTLAGVRALGNVDVGSAAGPVELTGAIDAAGSVRVAATAGTLTVGTAGINASTAGRGITLTAGGNVQIDGDLVANAATISVTSTGGSVTARVTTPGASPQEADATLNAGTDAGSSIVTVSGDRGVTLGGVIAHASVTANSANGDVRLLSPLGGANTGYFAYADGYQAALRPDVGTVTVLAPNGSVELNGLNVDGLRGERDGGYGLRVEAGRLILSNGVIAVNKGDILLQGGSTLPTDGVYLGSSVFSRGWDAVVGGVRQKIGYGIRIAGRNLGVFDNTTDVAELPGLYRATLSPGFEFNGQRQVLTDLEAYVVDGSGQRIQVNGEFQRVACDGSCTAGVTSTVRLVAASTLDEFAFNRPVLGEAVARVVPKIEISNNVANYRTGPLAADDRLVPTTEPGPLPRVVIATESIGAVTNVAVVDDNPGSARQSLSTFQPLLGGLSEGAARATPSASAGPSVASTRGVAIKVLGFEGAGDGRTEVWNTSLVTFREGRALDPNGIFGAIPFSEDTGFVPPNGQQLAVGPFARVDTVTQPWTHSAPIAGIFRFGTQGYFQVNGGATPAGAPTCVAAPCFAVYEFQRLSGNLSAFARVTRVTVVGANGQRFEANWESIPQEPSRAPVGIGLTVLMRFGGNSIISDGGGALGVEVTGALAGSGGLSGSVMQGGRYAQPVPMSANVPKWVQSSSGALTESSIEGAFRRGFAFGRVAVDTSAVANSFADAPNPFGPDTRGTRVVLFDGILADGLGPFRVDAVGGGAVIPGLGSIIGANNSTTTFTSVGGSTGPVGGVGAQGGSAIGQAPVVPPDPGFVATPPGDRSAQDALQGGTVATGGAALAVGPVQVGTSPVRQADLGRAGGLAGAAINVFGRRYRVAVAQDESVCAPGAIEAEAMAGSAAPAKRRGPVPASADGGQAQGSGRGC